MRFMDSAHGARWRAAADRWVTGTSPVMTFLDDVAEDHDYAADDG
jgi:hypothetical protein